MTMRFSPTKGEAVCGLLPTLVIESLAEMKIAPLHPFEADRGKNNEEYLP
jgi:hypothetical protein